jgi:quercetin dioxygenase-like cupin family protein
MIAGAEATTGRKQFMRTMGIGLAMLLASTAIGVAQQMPTVIDADGLKWGPAPPNLPPGAQVAVLSGDPSKEGTFTLRLKMPPQYVFPPHSVPKIEQITVLSGEGSLGIGDKVDRQKGQPYRAGSYINLPAKTNHYSWTTSETIVEIHSEGPSIVTYVNPADDPGKK